MSEKYFKNFPIIQYGEHSVRNIILKAKLAKNLLNNFDNFYPYTIRDDEKITTLSYNYYGSINFVWLIMAANDMVDPYYDWPLDSNQFDNYITKKYGSIEEASNINNALYYRSNNHSYWMTKTTYQNTTNVLRSGWSAVDNYTYELIINEEKRKIRLLDRSLSLDITNELELLFKKVNL